MPTATAPSVDPTLAAVRTQQAAVRQAEVGLLERVLDWAVEHTTDADPDVVTFGERPLALGGVGCPVIEEFAAYDLAAALGMSTDAGLGYLARALELRYRLPRLWAAVTQGRVPVWKAGRVAEATMTLPRAGAAYVDTRLAQAVSKISPTQTDRLVAEALARFDPDQAEADRLASLETRHVHIDHDGTTSRVEAVLDLPDALDLDDALRARAAALAQAGCEEPLEVRRAMALGELARGDQTLGLHTRELVVHVHTDSPEIARCQTTRAPITINQVRDWCATTAKVTIKPVLDVNDHHHVEAYEAPDRLRDQIHHRDQHCVFPHCTRRRVDLDHIVPFDVGGTTATDNLAGLCRRHHRAKTHSAWRYTSIGPGTFAWTSPSGLTYQRDHTGTQALDEPDDP